MNSPDKVDYLFEVRGLHKTFGDRCVLAGVSFSIPRGGMFSVLGPSGAGKSVLLKCLANIITPDAGDIFFDGMPLRSSETHAQASFRRRSSFLFQNNALFDSLTALENVALPLEHTTDLRDRDIRDRCLDALRQFELHNHISHYPSQLSGGMQKRLALARAIVTRPELVFFDEPTAGLDPLRRNAVFTMIAKYQRQFEFTALIVTHDVVEALLASDRVALLDHGQVCFEGTPSEFSASTHGVVQGFRDSAQSLGTSLAAIRRGERVANDDS